MIRPSGSGWRWSLVLSLAVGSPLGFLRPMSLPCSCWQSLSRSSSGRLMDPMVPFLLLVAAMQGGILLRVPLRGAPIETLAPIFGGWVLIAVLLDRRERSRIRPNSTAGSLLPGSLTALAAIVGLTIAAQAWRLDGRMLNLTEILTLVQLGVLVPHFRVSTEDPSGGLVDGLRHDRGRSPHKHRRPSGVGRFGQHRRGGCLF